MGAFSSPSFVFPEQSPAFKSYQALQRLVLNAGCRFPPDELFQALEHQMQRSPDPAMALTNLLRFAESTASVATLFNDLLQYPVLLETLVKIFGYSQYLSDILVRDPELFRWLTASDVMTKPGTRAYFTAEAARILGMFQRAERRMDALRRFSRREILRIGARDILGEADIVAVTGEVSMLADCLVHAAYQVAEQELRPQFKKIPKTEFTIIGLGKLGGFELNYSSDIDVMFVYREEGSCLTDRGKKTSHNEYFNRLAEKIVQYLSTGTSEGHLYRVDTRLRPESGAGPLARSLQSYLLYYETRGELWERQMLIKARTIAGDEHLGKDFVQSLQPFVYPRTFLRNPVEAIARMKGKIESRSKTEDSIKLRPGGIRDIEFTVQALQLLHGGKYSALRTGGTINTLVQLKNIGLLDAHDADDLHQAYVLYRTLEHRVQMELNTQTHAIPETEKGLASLAIRLGLPDASSLRGVLERHTRRVRELFEQVLATPSRMLSNTLLDAFERDSSGEELSAVVARYGLENAGDAKRAIAILARGKSLTATEQLDARTQDVFRELAPAIFDEVGASRNPDLALANLAYIVNAQQRPGLFYHKMREPHFRKSLIRICSVSPPFARKIALRPEVIDETVAGKMVLARSLVKQKNDRELFAGIRHILDETPLEQLTGGLTEIANDICGRAYTASRRKAQQAGSLAMFALGKFGSQELMFGSDLDLFFVSEAPNAGGRAAMERRAERMIGLLTQTSEDGTLYKVDVRLRPEGKNAPLTVQRDEFVKYLHQRASLWERQSMTRLRFVCGSKVLAMEIEQEVDDFVFESPLARGWVEQIVAMRKRMESRIRSFKREGVDLKLGGGGIVDIEFILQALLMKEKLRNLRARPVIETLSQLEGLSQNNRRVLSDSYVLCRSVEKYMRMTLEEHGHMLPSGKSLRMLSRCMGMKSEKDLDEAVRSSMKRVREVFLEVTGELST